MPESSKSGKTASPPPPRQPAKRAKVDSSTKSNGDLEVARLKYQQYSRVIDGTKVTVWILASWVPLQVVADIAKSIAGKTTQFTASMTISIAVSILVSIGWGVTALRSHSRKKEVSRLRARNDDLERRAQPGTRSGETGMTEEQVQP
ncbi:hypothetical protein Rhe02_52720 [Rhizocola hellebori]|uniref:Uncharacterized protein n=1 Tax=Rhizocola hellebori TaxID=1392758 RepID=A0A8J3QCM1_9ACTN|nr:hypothetical protein [Rhizocola hellebori]GIH07205.1 hypothetical protein Rhe02_52720 [Rhizocola hellebori]